MFKKKLTLSGITAGFSKVLTDLQALQAQNQAAITKTNEEIAKKQTEVSDLTTEASQAAAIEKNISALLKA